MRDIQYIAVHCSATSQTTEVTSIIRYWKKKKKWKNPGYHYIITADGKVITLLEEHLISNGVKGFNSEAVNICYIGGVDANNNPIDNRTELQKFSLKNMIEKLKIKYPNAIVQGHRDFPNVKKACPCFDVKSEYLDFS